MSASSLTLYRPGSSWLHRAPAGLKILALGVVTTTVMVVHQPLVSAGVALAVAVLSWVTLRSLRPWLCDIWALRYLIVLIGGSEAVFSGVWSALASVTLMLATVPAASVVTATTRTSALMAVAERLGKPLRRWGARPELWGLMVGLVLRNFSTLTQAVTASVEAHRARGARVHVGRVLTHTVTSAVRQSFLVAEALSARGFNEDDAAHQHSSTATGRGAGT